MFALVSKRADVTQGLADQAVSHEALTLAVGRTANHETEQDTPFGMSATTSQAALLGEAPIQGSLPRCVPFRSLTTWALRRGPLLAVACSARFRHNARTLQRQPYGAPVGSTWHPCLTAKT
jgi:hypothetical protein